MKVLKRVLAVLGIYLLFVFITSFMAYSDHKDVSQSYKDQFSTEFMSAAGYCGERAAVSEDGGEALKLRMAMIESAKEEILLSTFDFRDDESGQDVLACLIHKAEEGVKVKVLIDGFTGTFNTMGSENFKALASHPNAEIKIYRPIDLLKPWEAHVRVHDKFIVVDDEVYLLGGRNTNELFLGDYYEEVNYDREVLIYDEEKRENSSLQQLKSYFYQLWQTDESRLFYNEISQKKSVVKAKQKLMKRYENLKRKQPECFQPLDWAEFTYEAAYVGLLTNPIDQQNKEPEVWYGLSRMMEQAKDVIIQTPYIICSDDMYQDLNRVAGNGTEIKVITNSAESGANVIGSADLYNEKDNLLKTGIKLYEQVSDASIHTKSLLIDEAISVIGSFNVDMRSTYIDTETMVVIHCKPINEKLRQQADFAMSAIVN